MLAAVRVFPDGLNAIEDNGNLARYFRAHSQRVSFVACGGPCLRRAESVVQDATSLVLCPAFDDYLTFIRRIVQVSTVSYFPNANRGLKDYAAINVLSFQRHLLRWIS